jgi:hypothetical protein
MDYNFKKKKKKPHLFFILFKFFFKKKKKKKKKKKTKPNSIHCGWPTTRWVIGQPHRALGVVAPPPEQLGVARVGPPLETALGVVTATHHFSKKKKYIFFKIFYNFS